MRSASVRMLQSLPNQMRQITSICGFSSRICAMASLETPQKSIFRRRHFVMQGSAARTAAPSSSILMWSSSISSSSVEKSFPQSVKR